MRRLSLIYDTNLPPIFTCFCILKSLLIRKLFIRYKISFSNEILISYTFNTRMLSISMSTSNNILTGAFFVSLVGDGGF